MVLCDVFRISLVFFMRHVMRKSITHDGRLRFWFMMYFQSFSDAKFSLTSI